MGSSTSGGLTAVRPHLTALSPLQSFSPLHPPGETTSNPAHSRSHSRTPSWQSTGTLSGSAAASLSNSPVLSPIGGLQHSIAQAMRSPLASSPQSAPAVDASDDKGQGAEGLKRSRSNASSITKSLSRRQSFAASRASMGDVRPASEKAQPFHSHRGGLISKLLIVKAPAKDSQGEKENKAETPLGSRQ